MRLATTTSSSTSCGRVPRTQTQTTLQMAVEGLEFGDGKAARRKSQPLLRKTISTSTVQDKKSLKSGKMSIRSTLGDRVNLSWHHLTVTLPKNEKEKRHEPKVILNDLSGRIQAGQLMALMGASGAGKTTFLNLISGRMSSVLQVHGTLAINGHSVVSRDVRRAAAYVQQQDVFLPNLTVYEHLRVQAMLRMDNYTSVEDREEQVNKVMLELGLMKVRDTRIGSPIKGGRGLSGGEAKRLAFASEILTDPPLLFADEPTSGLDSFAALTVVRTLRQLADSGRTIICTIHQPPSEVFQRFQQLLLIAEGRTAYMGPIADGPETFARLGYPCPENYNHADFYIHTLSIIPGKEDECRARVNEITDDYQRQEEADGGLRAPLPESENLVNTLREMSHNRIQPLFTQAKWILWRSFVTSMREFQVVGVQLMQTIVMALMFGLVYLQINDGNGNDRVQNFAGAAMMVLVSASFTTLYPVVQVFPTEVVVLIRDHDNHMYKTWIFYFSKFFAELPITTLYSLLFTVITYFMIGFRVDADGFFTYFAVLLMAAYQARALGFFISTLAFDNAQLGLALVTPFVIPFMLFTGVFLNPDNVPDYLIWIDRTSWFKYQWEALLINEFDDLDLGSCGNGTAFCFENGDAVLKQLSLGQGLDQICFDFGILLALFFAFFISGLLILVLRIRYIKR
eukprot:scpid40592/ scgid31409/ Protein white